MLVNYDFSSDEEKDLKKTQKKEPIIERKKVISFV